jgi:isochorismate hydrolase
VAYSLTALSPAGNAVLDALTPKKYDSMLAEWRTLILHSQGIDDAIHPVP